MVIYLSLVFGVYFFFLLVCLAGWQKFISSKTQAGYFSGFVSVVVPFRNEADKISTLLESLLRQDFPLERFELIFVDDHSHDNSVQLLEKWCSQNIHINAKVMVAITEGKKNAITEGIQAAQGELILTTDADCQLPIDWITSMTGSFNKDTNMVVGLVKIQQDDSFFSQLQAVEFASLIGAGISLHSFGIPIMCNGASLAYRKKCFEEVEGYKDNLNIPSGDDEFLLRKIEKKYPGSVRTVKGISVVTTKAQATVGAFIQQRLRWAGKWKANDSMFSKTMAILIFVFQLSSVAMWWLMLTGDSSTFYGFLLVCKATLEAVFIFNVCKKTKQSFSLLAFLLLQVVYPVYVVIIAVLSQSMGFEWKGRKMKSIG